MTRAAVKRLLIGTAGARGARRQPRRRRGAGDHSPPSDTRAATVRRPDARLAGTDARAREAGGSRRARSPRGRRIPSATDSPSREATLQTYVTIQSYVTYATYVTIQM